MAKIPQAFNNFLSSTALKNREEIEATLVEVSPLTAPLTQGRGSHRQRGKEYWAVRIAGLPLG